MDICCRCTALMFTLLPFAPCFSIAAAPAPDAELSTAFNFSTGYKAVSYVVCGAVPGSQGCYGTGFLGPFGRIGAMVSGTTEVVGNLVRRAIYVVDVAAGNNANSVMLYRYVLTNSVHPPYDTVSLVQTNAVELPLVGGATVNAFLAASNSFVFVSTDQSPSAVRVAKQQFTVTDYFGGISVTSITTDDRGFTYVTYGDNTIGANYLLFGPDGNNIGFGGGTIFTLPQEQGISTKDLPLEIGSSAAEVKSRGVPRAISATP